MTKPILVADPNEEFGILIRQTLEESGRYDVSVASAGSEALRLAHDYTFELAIVDLAIPDIEGLALIRQLRELQPDLAIIAIPKGDALDASLARQARIDGVLSKPFYLPDLPEVVTQALSGRLGTGPLAAPRTPPSGAPTPSEVETSMASVPDAGAPSPWLSDPDGAAHYLARLTEQTTADASLLIRRGHLWASGGRLPVNQLQDLTTQVAESWADEARRGAIARFIRLPGMAIDHMLYATEVTSEITLALVYSAETPFGKIRQQAQELARTLADIDPGAPKETAPTQAHDAATEIETSAEELSGAPSFESVLAQEEPDLPVAMEAGPVEPSTGSSPEAEDRTLLSAAPFEGNQTSEAATPEALPTDWIPEQASASADRHLITQLAAGEPDGGIFPPQELTPPRPARVDLPLDWLPMITQSRRHMPYLEEPAPAGTGKIPDRAQVEQTAPPPPAGPQRPPAPPPLQPAEAETPADNLVTTPDAPETTVTSSAPSPPAGPPADQPPETPETEPATQPDVAAPSAGTAPEGAETHIPDELLGYYLVLVPRYPEHRLSGALTSHLDEWVRHLCVAWDWRADSVDVRDSALTIHLTLPPDTAPATAAESLAEGLSSRVLEMYPHLGAGVPSGRFWASQYLIQPGPGPTGALIDSFVEELRRAQGFRS